MIMNTIKCSKQINVHKIKYCLTQCEEINSLNNILINYKHVNVIDEIFSRQKIER